MKKKINLPALEGSEKQISWAESIRSDFQSDLENLTLDNIEFVYSQFIVGNNRLIGDYGRIDGEDWADIKIMWEDISVDANNKYPRLTKEQRTTLTKEERQQKIAERKENIKKYEFERRKKLLQKYGQKFLQQTTSASRYIDGRKRNY